MFYSRKTIGKTVTVETRKTENVANKLLDLAAVISKPNVGSPSWFILAARAKVLPERGEEKKELEFARGI